MPATVTFTGWPDESGLTLPATGAAWGASGDTAGFRDIVVTRQMDEWSVFVALLLDPNMQVPITVDVQGAAGAVLTVAYAQATVSAYSASTGTDDGVETFTVHSAGGDMSVTTGTNQSPF